MCMFTYKFNDFKTIDFFAHEVLNLNGCTCHDYIKFKLFIVFEVNRKNMSYLQKRFIIRKFKVSSLVY